LSCEIDCGNEVAAILKFSAGFAIQNAIAARNIIPGIGGRPRQGGLFVYVLHCGSRGLAGLGPMRRKARGERREIITWNERLSADLADANVAGRDQLIKFAPTDTKRSTGIGDWEEKRFHIIILAVCYRILSSASLCRAGPPPDTEERRKVLAVVQGCR
jgi:hypothetical protein